MSDFLGGLARVSKDEPEHHRAPKRFLVYGETGHEWLSSTRELFPGDSTKDLMGTAEFLWDGKEWQPKKCPKSPKHLY